MTVAKATLWAAAVGASATIAAAGLGGVMQAAFREGPSVVSVRPQVQAAAPSACISLDDRITGYFKRNPVVTRAIAAGRLPLPPLETAAVGRSCGQVNRFAEDLVKMLATAHPR